MNYVFVAHHFFFGFSTYEMMSKKKDDKLKNRLVVVLAKPRVDSVPGTFLFTPRI